MFRTIFSLPKHEWYILQRYPSKTMGPIHRIMLQLVGNSIVNLGLLIVIAIRLENINPVHMDQ